MVATVPAGFAPRAGEVTAVTNWPAPRFCWRLTFIGIASLGLLLPFIAPRRAVGQIKSNLSSSVTSESMTHVWVARDRGLFKKYGLEVEYLAFNSGRLGMQMLLSDEVQVLFSTGVTVVTTNLQKADLAIIAGGLNFFPTKLVTRPEIKRATDLKGKILAVGGFGAANHMALLVALEKLGINPKEVTIIQVAVRPRR